MMKTLINPRFMILGLLALAECGLLATGTAALAQANLRSNFPGRRIGGGTRGECAARVLAHLVPSNSVFAPGLGLTVALLEGPTTNPRPLQVLFRPQGAGETPSSPVAKRDLTPSPAGVTLLRVGPFKGAELWESTYRCSDPAPGSNDPINFVESVSPPALSLLVTDVTPNDRSLQSSLKRLRGLCGSQVGRADLAKAFALEDVIGLDWPAQLPVRCP